MSINHIKSHAMALAFIFQIDWNQIFQMRYCTLLEVKRLQKYKRSKLEVDKKLPTQPDSSPLHPGSGWSGRFFSTSNFDLWYFCSLLTYLLWKNWLLSVWRFKAKIMVWLLMWFMFAQSTLISYHTEVFVKTDVGCTYLDYFHQSKIDLKHCTHSFIHCGHKRSMKLIWYFLMLYMSCFINYWA